MPVTERMEPGLVGVSTKAFAVTRSDSVNHTTPARYLYVGTAGDVVNVNLDGTTVTYKNVPAGSYIMCASLRVNAVGTTATDIVGHI